LKPADWIAFQGRAIAHSLDLSDGLQARLRRSKSKTFCTARELRRRIRRSANEIADNRAWLNNLNNAVLFAGCLYRRTPRLMAYIREVLR
jgi:hypothetical protein